MKRYFLIAIIIFVCFIKASADSKPDNARIEINIPSRTLSLYKDNILFKEYPVCVGKRSTPTPQGEYRVICKIVNPYWINKDVVVPPGSRNPLGARWIGITKSIGIHGNNKPESIGTYASAGCIRMYNRDVEEVFALVPVNTPVIVKYDRSEIFEDKYSGERVVIIYQDSYKRGPESEKKLLTELSRSGIYEDLVKKAQEVMKKLSGNPLAVSQGIGVFLNDSLVTCDALEEQRDIFIYFKAAEEIFGLTLDKAGLLDIGIKEAEGKIYINLTQAVRCFGGSMRYDEEGGNVYISMRIIKINGIFAGINHGDYDKSDLLSAEVVKQLGYEYSEDSVDLRIFGKGMMKLKRKGIWVVNTDNLAEILGGCKNVNSRYGVVDIFLPPFLRLGKEYFKIDNTDERPALNADTAYGIYERSGLAAKDGNTDMEAFLDDYDYTVNDFSTVIEIKVKGK